MTPICSVVIPARAPDPWLAEAVDSLKNDGLGGLEIVVVWDTSDRIPIPSWAKDERVRVLHLGRHSGIPQALNAGVNQARGRYIARLDSDDVSLPGRLQHQIDFLESHREHVVVGTRVLLVDACGVEMQSGSSISGLDVRRELLERNVLTHSSVMFAREAFLSVGGYNVKCNRMQDYDLYLRLGQIGKVAVLPEIYVKYRLHSRQSSRWPDQFLTHMGEVLEGRTNLARHLGESKWRQAARNFSWASWQLLRVVGVRRMGFDRGHWPVGVRLRHSSSK